MLDTHACTQDTPSGDRAERTGLPIQNALAREVMLLCCSQRCSVLRYLLSNSRDFVLPRSADSLLEHFNGFI